MSFRQTKRLNYKMHDIMFKIKTFIAATTFV